MLFGATRLADIGGSLGKGIKEFRKEVASDEDEKPADTAASEPVASSNGGTETVAAVKCASCGALNNVGAKFCSQCSAAIAAPVT
jgi:Sec-independent protein translocase protein TatA